jgi:hypothetical protein
LRAHVARLDFGKILAEALHDRGGAGLVLVAVENELSLLLRLRHVRIGGEIEHLGGWLRRALRQHGRRRDAREWRRSEHGSGLQHPTPRYCLVQETRHRFTPLFQFLCCRGR